MSAKSRLCVTFSACGPLTSLLNTWLERWHTVKAPHRPNCVGLGGVKQCIPEGMIRAAQHRIAQKVEAEGWASDGPLTRTMMCGWVWGVPATINPASFVVTTLTSTPVGFGKHEDRTQSNVCQLSARILHEHLNAADSAAKGSVPMNTTIRTALRAYFQHSLPTDDCVCRASGRGDNTVGHWSRWCIVPLIVVCYLLKLPRIPMYIAQIACDSDRNTAVCSLVIAQFRRLLRQEGAFLHQDTGQAKRITWWIDELLVQVTSESHLQLRLDRYMPPVVRACSLDHQNIRLARTIPISLQALLLSRSLWHMLSLLVTQ